MKRLLLILFLMVSEVSAQNQAAVFTAAWWNVENLFDLRDDPKTNDDEFTPTGDRHWTRRRLNDKVNGIYKVTAINAARKSEKNANNDNSDDGVRFFLILEEFIPYGDSIPVGNTLHNADWMTLEESKEKYEVLEAEEKNMNGFQ